MSYWSKLTYSTQILTIILKILLSSICPGDPPHRFYQLMHKKCVYMMRICLIRRRGAAARCYCVLGQLHGGHPSVKPPGSRVPPSHGGTHQAGTGPEHDSSPVWGACERSY